jgi:uncharacterized protein
MLIEMLTQEEARVLGTLVEKSLATPDYYPLTLNSLRTACNQKSNRDPVTDYNDETVTEALVGLKRKVLVTFIPYGSQGNLYKYRHFLEDLRFNLSKPEIAVLAVLLLRGSQTLNEVKLRASSLCEIDSLETTENLLKGLANRSEALVESLPKRPGWKEPRWRDRIRPPMEENQSAESENGQLTSMPVRSQREEIESLKNEIADLRLQFSSLKDEVEKLKSDLY